MGPVGRSFHCASLGQWFAKAKMAKHRHCRIDPRFGDLSANAWYQRLSFAGHANATVLGPHPPDGIKVHFCEPEGITSVQRELTTKDIALFELDGATINSREQLFHAFAGALKMPKGWYGNEEYAPNVDSFLEYLDDVHEWVPAKGHIVVLRNAEEFWKSNNRLACMLIEWWQFATGPGRKADIHLLFVW
jgi:hypothetical protein